MFVNARYIHAASIRINFTAKDNFATFVLLIPETESFDHLQSRCSRRLTRRARTHDDDREDWSSMLQNKNLFSIMSEDTFLVRRRYTSELSELRAAQLFYRPLLRNFIAGRQLSLRAISLSFLLVHYPSCNRLHFINDSPESFRDRLL